MNRKELEALLGDVAAQNVKTTDAANLIGGALRAARAPWLAVTIVGCALAAVLGLGVRGCVEYNLAEARRACPKCEACATPECPPPNCNGVWEQARKHHAREMLRGLRLTCGSYVVENER